MNTNEVAIRCGEHAFTRLQKLLPQQDRLLPKIYQTTDDQYIIYWDSIRWFESSDKGETELVKAFNRAFDYLEERPFDQEGNLLPGWEPDQKFSTKKDAWDKAMSMAMTEADTASNEKEDETAEIIMEKAKSEISLVYPKSAEENSFCRYYITKEKGE